MSSSLTASTCHTTTTERAPAVSNFCIRCIKRDVVRLYKDPLPGIFVASDESDLTHLHALVAGPMDTPYEGGFFLFDITFPFDYPYNPPEVTLLTTGGGTVRFNPNLYKNGKVCLSILGTWDGPPWSPSQWLGSVLLSIQSLMNHRPYHNEPGYEANEKNSNMQDALKYNSVIRHEVLRVAVLEMVGDTALYRSLPGMLKEVVDDCFLSFADVYEITCETEMFRDGTSFCDPFNTNQGTFQYKTMQRQLASLLQQKRQARDEM